MWNDLLIRHQHPVSSDKNYLKRFAGVLKKICFGFCAYAQDLDNHNSVAPTKQVRELAQGCVIIKKNEWIYFTTCHTRHSYTPV